MNLKKKQQGAVAIEFALLFGVFFAILYGIIAFSIPLAVHASLKHAASEAARSLVQVDLSDWDESYGPGLNEHVEQHINLWHGLYTVCAGEVYFVKVQLADGNSRAEVCISYQGPKGSSKNYNEDPIIHMIELPGIGSIPRLPDIMEGRAGIFIQ